jgi:para-nitrobenzyl esterase
VDSPNLRTSARSIHRNVSSQRTARGKNCFVIPLVVEPYCQSRFRMKTPRDSLSQSHPARLLLGILPVLLWAALPARCQIQTVKVTGGEVRGVIQDGIASFKGIPFAAPPVGELRWRAPQPVKPWQGVRPTDTFAPAPMQNALATLAATALGGSATLSEDCLYLNVWTPAKSADEKLPVMVWIYGGGFMSGLTSIPVFDGTRLAQKGVVLVTIAYRLGPFGFLAHPELSRESGKGSGCYGIQDQVASLRWVKDNITQFGGDPSRVTIFGESAGGESVSMLTTVPAARGLFQRAISQSGGSMAPVKRGDAIEMSVLSLPYAEAAGEKFLRKLGVSSIKAARALSASEIQKIESATEVQTALTQMTSKNAADAARMFSFWPVADGETLLGDESELYEAGEFHDTPVLIGWNSDEGAGFVRTKPTPEAFKMQVRTNSGPVAEAILKAYPHSTTAEAFKAAKDVLRDGAFAWHTWTWAKLQTRKGKNKAFVYYFDQRTPSSPDGSTHAAEFGFVFRNLKGWGVPWGVPSTPENIQLSDLMSSYWVNFATSGDPNGPGLPEWPAFTEKDMKVMFFDKNPSARPMPHLEKLMAIDAYYAWRRQQAKQEPPSAK